MSKAPETLKIHFAPVTVNAFSGGQGYWSKYEILEADNITSLCVTPVLRIYNVDDYRYLKIDCIFEERDLPQEKYGLVYGDEEFEEDMARHLNEILGFDEPIRIVYTEHGMQDDDLVSMESNDDAIAAFDQLSSHALLALLGNKQITQMLINGIEQTKETAQCPA